MRDRSSSDPADICLYWSRKNVGMGMGMDMLMRFHRGRSLHALEIELVEQGSLSLRGDIVGLLVLNRIIIVVGICSTVVCIVGDPGVREERLIVVLVGWGGWCFGETRESGGLLLSLEEFKLLKEGNVGVGVELVIVVFGFIDVVEAHA
jgi:hypothetical protein